MFSWVPKSATRQRFATALGTVVVAGIFFDRVLALRVAWGEDRKPVLDIPASGNGAESVTLVATADKKKPVKGNNSSLCEKYEGKIISYIDQISLVKKCEQRPLVDPEILNALLASKKYSVNEVSAAIYRSIPMGKDYERIDFLRTSPDGLGEFQRCGKFNNSYVTFDGEEYYFVKNCRRQFVSNFYKLQSAASNQSVIYTISPEELEAIPLGEKFVTKQQSFDIDSILYRMDDHLAWSRFYRRRDPQISQNDSPEVMNQLLKKKEAGAKSGEFCKKFNKRIVAFFSEIYFVEGCTRHLINDMSIELQEYAETHSGGIFEMTPEELQSMKRGDDFSSDQVLKRFQR